MSKPISSSALMDTIENQERHIEALRTALLLLLDNIDYSVGNCRPNEMIAAILPREILVVARRAVSQ